MNLTEAAALVGHRVTYSPPGAGVYLPPRERQETGVITRVTQHYVFVRYDGDHTPKATRPEDLALAPAAPDG